MTLRAVGDAAPDRKNDRRRGWVGRSIRRVEDPALVAGHGRFTGNLPAARHVRFVRSSVASGSIVRIAAPEGAMVLTAAELESVTPIRPMLHRFNYVPISQPVLARDIVRFVGQPLAAVVASSRDEAEDIADSGEVEIEKTAAIVGNDAALAPGAELVHAEAAEKIAGQGRVQTPGRDSELAPASRRLKVA